MERQRFREAEKRRSREEGKQTSEKLSQNGKTTIPYVRIALLNSGSWGGGEQFAERSFSKVRSSMFIWHICRRVKHKGHRDQQRSRFFHTLSGGRGSFKNLHQHCQQLLRISIMPSLATRPRPMLPSIVVITNTCSWKCCLSVSVCADCSFVNSSNFTCHLHVPACAPRESISTITSGTSDSAIHLQASLNLVQQAWSLERQIACNA